MPKFITYDGRINTADEFRKICQSQGVNDANVFFIFPSNTIPGNKHHTEHGATLYSHKSGAGLAHVADFLGKAGIATLGLPTKGDDLNNLKNVASIPAIAKNAVADIWKAVGSGLTPILPVRDFDYHVENAPPNGLKNGNGIKYFTHPLGGADRKEPRFYGENESNPNLVLADYYVQQLNLLQQFLALDVAAQQAFISNPPAGITPEIIQAYNDGVAAKSAATKPAWFAKTPQPTPAPVATTPQNSSPIKYGEQMNSEDVITAIKGYMLQAGNNVKGVLVEHGLGGTISTTKLSDNDFEVEFIKIIDEARTHLDKNQTRIIIPVHLGDHFATVAIDVRNYTAVIIEPTNGYKTQVDKIQLLLEKVFNSPAITVQRSQTKIQENDNFSCGLIASNLAAHLLSCSLSITEAINEQNLPKILYPLNTEDQKKALLADVQNAHRVKTDAKKKKDLEYDCAVQATVLGLFNLIATGQLDDAKYNDTQIKLLKLYEAYLLSENNGSPIDKSLITWPNFKQFLQGQNTAEAQQQLAGTFKDLWRGQFLEVLKNRELLKHFRQDLYEILEKEFKDFLANTPSDGKEKNYERFSYIKNAFIQFKNDARLRDTDAKIAAFDNWWRGEGKGKLIDNYIGTADGKKFPNEFDLHVSIAYLRGIDFDLGVDAKGIRNKYTPGYGDVITQDLTGIFGTVSPALIKDLCDEAKGVFTRLVDQHSNPFYRFKKMSDVDRTAKLKVIIAKSVSVRDAAREQNILAQLLADVDPKQSHPTLALTKQGDQWNIVDDPNNTWLKIKSFKAELPAVEQAQTPDEQDSAQQDSTNTVTTPKIDFQNNPTVMQKLKELCEDFKSKNAGKNYEVVSNDKINVCGELVKIIPTGFEYKKVTQEIIEFAVKAMAEIFTQQGISDPAKRLVKLTLTPENEKFRKAYKDELKKYDLTLEEEAASTLQVSQPRDTQQKWRDMHGQHTADQIAAGQPAPAQQSAAPTATPGATQTAAPGATPTSSTTGQPAAPSLSSSGTPATPASPAAPAAASTPPANQPAAKTPPLTGSASGTTGAAADADGGRYRRAHPSVRSK